MVPTSKKTIALAIKNPIMLIAMRNPGSENKSKMEKRNKSAKKPIKKQANKQTILSMILVSQSKTINTPMAKAVIEQK